MEELWSLFFTLQIISYLSIFDSPIPANSELYLRELRSLVEFDIVNPEKLLARFGVDFSLSETIFGITENATIAVNKYSGMSVLENIEVYILLLGMLLVFVALCLVLIRFLRHS